MPGVPQDVEMTAPDADMAKDTATATTTPVEAPAADTHGAAPRPRTGPSALPCPRRPDPCRLAGQPVGL